MSSGKGYIPKKKRSLLMSLVLKDFPIQCKLECWDCIKSCKSDSSKKEVSFLRDVDTSPGKSPGDFFICRGYEESESKNFIDSCTCHLVVGVIYIGLHFESLFTGRHAS